MKERLLADEVKSRIFRLMRNASKAHSAVKAAEHSPKTTTEELTKLRSEASTSANQLQDAVREFSLDKIKELSSSAQYIITHEPLMAVGSGKYSWDERLADQLTNTLRSLRNALILKTEQYNRNDERVAEVSKRIHSMEAFMNLVEATGVPPVKGDRKGIDYEVVQFQLRKLNEKIAELNTQAMALGDTEDEKKSQLHRKAGDLNDLYTEAEKALKWLKPFERSPRPKTGLPLEQKLPEGVTVNADTNRGIASLDKTLSSVGDPAPAAVPEVSATEAASAAPEALKEAPKVSKKTRRPR